MDNPNAYSKNVRYEEARPLLKSGDCLLWRSSTVIGSLIRWFTGHRVNHAGLVVRPYKLGFFYSRRFTLEALEPGVVLRLLSERLRGFDGKVWLHPLADRFDMYRNQVVTKALEQEGVPYDYWSLFRQILGRVSVESSRYFCSEYCYAVYRAAGLPVPKVERAPRPGDLPKLPIFKPAILLYDSKEDAL